MLTSSLESPILLEFEGDVENAVHGGGEGRLAVVLLAHVAIVATGHN